MSQETTESNCIIINMEEFIKIVNNAKLTSYTSGELRHSKDHYLKVTSSDDRLTRELFTEDRCRCCGKNNYRQELIVKFRKPTLMTIFEAEFLFMLFINGKVLRDYSDYHDSIAGRNFIENIVSIEVKVI